MIKELQNYVTKKTGAWMSPRKVSYVLFTQFVDLISISLAKQSEIHLHLHKVIYLYFYLKFNSRFFLKPNHSAVLRTVTIQNRCTYVHAKRLPSRDLTLAQLNALYRRAYTNIVFLISYQIEFMDAFPTTLTGKINRNELKQKEWNQFNK